MAVDFTGKKHAIVFVSKLRPLLGPDVQLPIVALFSRLVTICLIFLL